LLKKQDLGVAANLNNKMPSSPTVSYKENSSMVAEGIEINTRLARKEHYRLSIHRDSFTIVHITPIHVVAQGLDCIPHSNKAIDVSTSRLVMSVARNFNINQLKQMHRTALTSIKAIPSTADSYCKIIIFF